MKKVLLFVLAVFIMGTASIASAARYDDSDRDRHRQEDSRDHDSRYRHYRNHDWSHSAYRDGHWRSAGHWAEGMPFRWHDRRDRFYHYRMERMYHHGWGERFPGLHPYRWHGEGREFWYRGHRVTDGVMFYDDSDELVSVGFWHDGAFIMIRDDGSSYENHDSFFLSWHN